ncbi:MAG: iron-sulfur cluster insertion protein ErpA [Candidatus Dasytiphilus stammeri]
MISVNITDAAIAKVKLVISKKNNFNLKLRIYIIGGGCSGFQYGFILDEKIKKGDVIIEKNGIMVLIDYISFPYLIGSCIDYVESLEKTHFIVHNPNAKITCSCGLSFSL